VKAVLLDAASLGTDIDLSPLRAVLTELVVHARTAPEQVLPRLADCDIAITNKVLLDGDTLARLPALKLISVLATGTNNIDHAAAQALGISLRNVRAYGTESVAQHTLMMMLALANRLPRYQRDMVEGRWQQSRQFCLLDYPTMQLAGKQLVIVGQGELGQRVAALASAFGMQISFCARPGATDDQRPTLQTLAPQADIISLHCPLNTHTRHLIDAELLARCQASMLLINCSRGSIIDESAALRALQQGRLGGLGVDVLPEEPPRQGHPLLDALLATPALNLIVTPHNAWISPEARQRVVSLSAAAIADFRAQAQ